MTSTDQERMHEEAAVSRGRRRAVLGTAAIATAALGALLPAMPALAHHGWPGFDTDRLVYIAGVVSSNGVWGNPHSLFDVTLDSTLPGAYSPAGNPDGVAGSGRQQQGQCRPFVQGPPPETGNRHRTAGLVGQVGPGPRAEDRGAFPGGRLYQPDG